jgi:hypothetical protein
MRSHSRSWFPIPGGIVVARQAGRAAESAILATGKLHDRLDVIPPAAVTGPMHAERLPADDTMVVTLRVQDLREIVPSSRGRGAHHQRSP